MTDFEKKIRGYHNKKLKYNKDSQALIMRLRKEEAEKCDFPEEKMNIGYNVFEKSQNLPTRANKKVHFWRRVIITLIAIVIIVLLTMWARYRFGWIINIAA